MMGKGYRDSDSVDLTCRMWDSLQNMLASIELRLDALESSHRTPRDFSMLNAQDSICRTCRAKTVCSHSSIKRYGHVVLECADYIVEGTPCEHEWHADQDSQDNVCIKCGIPAGLR
jgi:hypothetical protein